MPIVAGVNVGYPDRIDRRPGTHVSRQAFTTRSAAPGSSGIVGAVDTFFPDFILRKKVHPASQLVTVRAGAPTLPPVPAIWSPPMPVRRIWTPPAQVVFPQGGLFPVIVPIYFPRGIFPDWIARKRYPAAQQRPTVLGPQSSNPPPALSWTPRFPARLDPALRTAWFQSWAQNLDPLVNAAAPALAWGPAYPSFLLRAPTLHPASQLAVSVSEVRPRAPEFSWQAIAPDWIARSDPHPSAMPTFGWAERIIAPDLGFLIDLPEPTPAWLRIGLPGPPLGMTVKPFDVTLTALVTPTLPNPTVRRFVPPPTGRVQPPPVLQTFGALGWATEDGSAVLRPFALVRRPSGLLVRVTAETIGPPAGESIGLQFDDLGLQPAGLTGLILLSPSLTEMAVIDPRLNPLAGPGPTGPPDLPSQASPPGSGTGSG